MTDSVQPDRETLIAKAMAHHRAGRLGEAEAAYRSAIQSSPDDVGARAHVEQ